MIPEKTLNDHLFEALERLASADSENIDVEINKSSSIVHVSEQILSVARFKLEVIKSNVDIKTGFKELDSGMPKELFNVDKEENWVASSGDPVRKK